MSSPGLVSLVGAGPEDPESPGLLVIGATVSIADQLERLSAPQVPWLQARSVD